MMKFVVLASLLWVVLSEFDPYVDNFGTIVGIAGRNFSLIAGDTRLSDQYMIRSRNHSKLFKISDNICFSGSGCWSDIYEVSKVLTHQSREFHWESDRPLQIHEAASLLSKTLYQRRFFPYYTFSLLTGMDSEGIGAVYRYDAVGSFERVRTACAGKGEKLIQPFLDEIGNLDADDSLWEEFNSENDKASRTTFDPLFAANILQGASTVANAYPLEIDDGLDNIAKCKSKPYLDISEDDACKLVVRSFLAASEREISVGDGLEIWIQRYADTETNTDELPLLQAKESSDEDTSGSLKRTMIPSRVGLKKRGRVMLEKKYYSLPEH